MTAHEVGVLKPHFVYSHRDCCWQQWNKLGLYAKAWVWGGALLKWIRVPNRDVIRIDVWPHRRVPYR